MAATSLTPRTFDDIYLRRSRQRLLDRTDKLSLQDPIVRSWDATSFMAPGEPDELCHVLNLGRACNRSPFRILDLGCGTCGAARFVAKRLKCSVYGIDFSQVALQIAGSRTGHDVRTAAADFKDLPWPDGAFHAAFSLDALYLSADRQGSLNELARVLVDGSPLIFTAYVKRIERTAALESWKQALDRAGFIPLRIMDRSVQWRQLMRKKHQSRLDRKNDLLEADGPEIEAELDVSRAMLGCEQRPSFLDAHSRLWYSARRYRPKAT